MFTGRTYERGTLMQAKRSSISRRLVVVAIALLATWGAVAYLIMPRWWSHYERKHPWLDDSPRLTKAGDGIPGDPLNVALVGTKEELIRIMIAAKWRPADPLTFDSSIRIAVDAVFK